MNPLRSRLKRHMITKCGAILDWITRGKQFSKLVSGQWKNLEHRVSPDPNTELWLQFLSFSTKWLSQRKSGFRTQRHQYSGCIDMVSIVYSQYIETSSYLSSDRQFNLGRIYQSSMCYYEISIWNYSKTKHHPKPHNNLASSLIPNIYQTLNKL